MAVHPNSGNVLGFLELLNSENAADKIELLAAITQARPQIDCIIHDDACHLEQQVFAETRNNAANIMVIRAKIRYFILDRFHARNHKCGPRNRPDTPANQTRLSSVNTSRAESVFAWFRNYHHCNTMRRKNFLFFLQEMCRRHNCGKKAYLNKCARSKVIRGVCRG